MTWIKKNLTLTVIITLLCGYAGGAGAYAVLKSDVALLKGQVANVPERLARIEESIKYTQQGVNKLLDRELNRVK